MDAAKPGTETQERRGAVIRHEPVRGWKSPFSLNDRRLLGVHIIGEGATELLHIGQAVLNLGGAVDDFVENAFNYLTPAEAYKIAALDAFNRMR